jgi:type IX secretion system PorP/SprF family membrane protein
MKKRFLLLVLMAACGLASAQDEAIFSHYLINPVLINPAASGFGDVYQLQLNARAQWSGFADAPQTYAAQYNGPLGNNFGLGFGVLTETAAQINRTRAHLNYAFRFDVGDYVKLSAGFSADYQRIRLDNAVAGSVFFQEGDRVIADFMDGQGVFDASIGLFSSINDNTQIGLAFTDLVRSRVSAIEENDESLLKYYLFFASHRIDVEDLNFIMEPSILVRRIRDVPSQVDINLKASFLDEVLTTGLSYRSLGSLGFLLGLRMPPPKENKSNLFFHFYYSYDLFFQQFQRYNDGSHEVTVALSFGRAAKPGYRRY